MAKATTIGLVALAASLQMVSAHSGCDGYRHGHDLFRREPSQEVYYKALEARFGPVPARVLTDPADIAAHEKRRSLKKRQNYPASLTSVNSAVLASISSGTQTEATEPLPTTYAAGATSPVDGAQPLPAVTIIPSDWPALDRPPPTDTPEVQQWLSQIDLSGIPSYGPTGVGGCQNTTVNSQAISEAGPNDRCWWTCGGCTRNTDITYCPEENTWGISYDDGPSPYTPKLMNYLAEADLQTTIFTVGSRAISRPDMLQYEYLAGHQLAVHTWSHFPLTTLTNEQIVAEFGWSKKAIYEITGVTPKYVRAPYGDVDDRVRYIMAQMGLTNVIWTAYNGQTFDTRDWQIAGGVVNTSTVIANFDSILSQAGSMGHGFIVLEHDLYSQSVDLAVSYVLPNALRNKDLKLQTIIQCLGMDLSQAYVETATNASTGLVPTTPIVGASGTGLVPGLSYTPVALGGDATGPLTTRGVSGTGQKLNPSATTGAAQAATENDTSSALRSVMATSLAACGVVAALFVFLA